jgi:hypothetical protein
MPLKKAATIAVNTAAESECPASEPTKTDIAIPAAAYTMTAARLRYAP